jgi:tRNA(Ser,Leu) C12 N-acetylase TAN1
VNQTIYVSPENKEIHDEIKALAKKNKLSFFDQIVRIYRQSKKDGERTSDEIADSIKMLADELAKKNKGTGMF